MPWVDWDAQQWRAWLSEQSLAAPIMGSPDALEAFTDLALAIQARVGEHNKPQWDALLEEATVVRVQRNTFADQVASLRASLRLHAIPHFKREGAPEETLVRYCPQCGSLGPVARCCRHSDQAVFLPRDVAEQAQAGLLGALSRREAAAQAHADEAEPELTWPDLHPHALQAAREDVPSQGLQAYLDRLRLTVQEPRLGLGLRPFEPPLRMLGQFEEAAENPVNVSRLSVQEWELFAQDWKALACQGLELLESLVALASPPYWQSQSRAAHYLLDYGLRVQFLRQHGIPPDIQELGQELADAADAAGVDSPPIERQDVARMRAYRQEATQWSHMAWSAVAWMYRIHRHEAHPSEAAQDLRAQLQRTRELSS